LRYVPVFICFVRTHKINKPTLLQVIEKLFFITHVYPVCVNRVLKERVL
jgi:hypothetical protein